MPRSSAAAAAGCNGHPAVGSRVSDGLVPGPDGALRCWWGASTPDYAAYHDEEWGRPVRDDHGLYERLCLEAFQSGLSWLTILRKREALPGGLRGLRAGRAWPRSATRTSRG